MKLLIECEKLSFNSVVNTDDIEKEVKKFCELYLITNDDIFVYLLDNAQKKIFQARGDIVITEHQRGPTKKPVSLVNIKNGVGQCSVCLEHLLEDERHFHTLEEIGDREVPQVIK